MNINDSLPCFGLLPRKTSCSHRVPRRILESAADNSLLRCKKCGSTLPAKVYKQTVEIILTPDEMLAAGEVGGRRNAEAKAAGLPDVHGYSGNGLEVHVLGAQAELAAAKFLGVDWEATINTFKAPDVLDYQVRGRKLHGYDLIVRLNDSDRAPFILVVGTGPFYVVGWLYGHEAKREEWLATHGGREKAYFVPKSALHDPRQLLSKSCTVGSQPPIGISR